MNRKKNPGRRKARPTRSAVGRLRWWLVVSSTVALAVSLAAVVSAVPGQAAKNESPAAENPAATGFNLVASDARAIAIADEVMKAMGGRDSWDKAHFLSWNFFGMRTHVWDKWSGDLRFEHDDRLTLMNVNTKKGRVFVGGEEITDARERGEALEAAYRAWINDMYWLAMPFKLKDSGVTLTYAGEGELADGRAADILQLTFEGVGVTPQNKYDVYVSKDKRLVEQWSFYAEASDPEPRFSTPWAKWTAHGNLLLSGDRGERQLSDIRVFDELPRSVFESPAAVDMSALPSR